MAKKWIEVIASQGYLGLTDMEKAQAQDAYFNEVVAPQIPAAEHSRAKIQFLTEHPPPGAINEPGATSGDMIKAMAGAGQPPESTEGGTGMDDLIPSRLGEPQPEAVSRSVTMGASPEGMLSGRFLGNMPKGYNPGYTLPKGPIHNPDYLPNLPREEDLPPEPGVGEIAGAAVQSVPYRLGKGAAGVVRMAEGQVEASIQDIPRESEYSLARVQAAEKGALEQYDETNARARAEHELPGEKFYHAAEKRLDEIRPKGLRPGSAKNYIFEGVGAAAENIPLLAVGAFTGPATPLALMATRVAGDHYGEMRDAGRGHLESVITSAGYGAAEAIGEKTPMAILLDKDLPFLKRLVKSYLPEVGGELVTESLQSAIDKGTIDPEMTWDQFKDRMVDTAIVASIAQPILAGAGHVAVKGAERIQNGQAETKPGGQKQAEVAAKLDAALAREEARPQKETGGFTDTLSNVKIADLEAQQEAQPEVAQERAQVENAQDVHFPTEAELRQTRHEENVRKHGLSPEAAKDFEPVEKPDTVTGLTEKHDRPPTVKRAMQHVADTGASAFYVETDIRNMGGINATLGHNEADKVIRAMVDIWSEELKKTGSTVHMFRHGGDEISAVVLGKDTSEIGVSAALDRASVRIDEYIRGKGLDIIPHGKNKTDPTPVGTGIYYGVSKITPEGTLDNIFSEADTIVEKKKKERNNVQRSETETAGTLPPEGRPGSPGQSLGRESEAYRTREAGTQSQGVGVETETATQQPAQVTPAP
ncbi:MAG: diguanylate cyclase, partial [Nitrospinota bacterium]|nr:diguanylate cyclase [Nitrospinota bacterium]